MTTPSSHAEELSLSRPNFNYFPPIQEKLPDLHI